MRILGIIFAALAITLGLRIAFIAIMTVFSGKVLVRKGFRSSWQTPANTEDIWRYAFRDAIMGILLIILGVALIF
jgi:hypothetical protein